MVKKIAIGVVVAVVFFTVIGAAGSGLPSGLPQVPFSLPGGEHTDTTTPDTSAGGEKQAQSSKGGAQATPGAAQAKSTPQAEPADPAAIITDHQAILLLNPATVMAGGTVNVSGSGFTPGATIDLVVKKDKGDKGQSLGFVQADQSGSFGGFSFTLPQDYAGRSFLLVGRQHDGKFEATAQGNAAANSPVVKFGTQVGKPGDSITYSAKGFVTGEEVKVYFNSLSGQPITTVKMDASGGLRQASIRVPFGAVGNNSFIFMGDKSQSPVTVPFLMLNLYPNAAVSAYAAKADTTLTFTGDGFGPHERVSVHLNSPSAPPLAVFEADDKGAFAGAGAFLIPFNLSGKNTFILVGEQSQAAATVSFDVLPYAPYAEPSTYGGRPGTTITFYGSGFARDEVVRVFAGATRDNPGQEVACFKTDNQGNVRGEGSYTVPGGVQKGTMSFRLVGDKSRGVATAAIQVMDAGGPVQVPTAQPYSCPYDNQGQSQTAQPQSGQAQPQSGAAPSATPAQGQPQTGQAQPQSQGQAQATPTAGNQSQQKPTPTPPAPTPTRPAGTATPSQNEGGSQTP